MFISFIIIFSCLQFWQSTAISSFKRLQVNPLYRYSPSPRIAKCAESIQLAAADGNFKSGSHIISTDSAAAYCSHSFKLRSLNSPHVCEDFRLSISDMLKYSFRDDNSFGSNSYRDPKLVLEGDGGGGSQPKLFCSAADDFNEDILNALDHKLSIAKFICDGYRDTSTFLEETKEPITPKDKIWSLCVRSLNPCKQGQSLPKFEKEFTSSTSSQQNDDLGDGSPDRGAVRGGAEQDQKDAAEQAAALKEEKAENDLQNEKNRASSVFSSSSNFLQAASVEQRIENSDPIQVSPFFKQLEAEGRVQISPLSFNNNADCNSISTEDDDSLPISATLCDMMRDDFSSDPSKWCKLTVYPVPILHSVSSTSTSTASRRVHSVSTHEDLKVVTTCKQNCTSTVIRDNSQHSGESDRDYVNRRSSAIVEDNDQEQSADGIYSFFRKLEKYSRSIEAVLFEGGIWTEHQKSVMRETVATEESEKGATEAAVKSGTLKNIAAREQMRG